MKRMNTYVRLGIGFGVAMGVYFSITDGVTFGVPGGIVAGFLFGFMFWVIGKVQAKKFNSFRSDFAKLHEILYEDTATYFAATGYVEGRLFLTSEGLFFKPKKENAKVSEFWIYCGAIKSASTYKRRLIGHGFLIEQKDGSQKKFDMLDPQMWVIKVEPLIPQ